jgi:TP901 family phage tail tape measure protein
MAAGAGAIRAGAAFVELLVKADPLQRGLNAAAARVESFGKSVAGIGAKIAAAGGIISAPFIGAAKEFAETGAELEKLSRATGIGAGALSELAFAAGGADVLNLAFRGLSQTLASAATGGKAAQKDFAALGLSVADLQKMNPEERFTAVAKAVAAIGDPMRRGAMAMDMFKRGGRELLPALSKGADHIDVMRKKAQELGLALTDDQVKAADAMSKAYKALNGSIKGVWMTIGGAVAPILTELVGLVTKVVQWGAKWVKENRELAVTAFKWGLGITVVGTSLVALGGAFAVLNVALSGFAAIFGLVTTILGAVLSPVGLATAAIAGLGYALFTQTGLGAQALDMLRRRFGGLADTASTAWGGIKDAMAAGDLAGAANIAWLAVKVAFLDLTQEIRIAWVDVQIFLEKGWAVIKAFAQEAAAFVADEWAKAAPLVKQAWEVTFDFFKGQIASLEKLLDDLNIKFAELREAHGGRPEGGGRGGAEYRRHARRPPQGEPRGVGQGAAGIGPGPLRSQGQGAGRRPAGQGAGGEHRRHPRGRQEAQGPGRRHGRVRRLGAGPAGLRLVHREGAVGRAEEDQRPAHGDRPEARRRPEVGVSHAQRPALFRRRHRRAEHQPAADRRPRIDG